MDTIGWGFFFLIYPEKMLTKGFRKSFQYVGGDFFFLYLERFSGLHCLFPSIIYNCSHSCVTLGTKYKKNQIKIEIYLK